MVGKVTVAMLERNLLRLHENFGEGRFILRLCLCDFVSPNVLDFPLSRRRLRREPSLPRALLDQNVAWLYIEMRRGGSCTCRFCFCSAYSGVLRWLFCFRAVYIVDGRSVCSEHRVRHATPGQVLSIAKHANNNLFFAHPHHEEY